MTAAVKISALPLATPTAADLVPIVQGGVTSYTTVGALGPLGTFLQSGTGAIAETVQSRGRWKVYATDFMTTAQREDVRAFTLLVNVAAAVQAAIDFTFTTGTTLVFPAGGYLLGTTTLVFKNKVKYVGAGKDIDRAKGTLLQYTGTSDAIQINNPIDSSTAANISVEDLWAHCTTRTAGKAAIADVGSTFLKFNRVGVSGNDYGIILDQSELADIDECDFEVTAASSTGGLWIANGDDHTVSASIGFTNRISVNRCQFNSTVGGIGIIDDGGYVHAYQDNNYNGFANHARFAGVTGLALRGGECESATSTNFLFAATSYTGGDAVSSCIDVEFGGGIVVVPAAGQSCISVTGLNDITFTKCYFGNTAVAKVVGTANINTLIGLGIYNAGGGATFNGVATRHFDLNPSIGLLSTAILETNFQVKIIGLAGAGSRTVVADSNGVLSAP